MSTYILAPLRLVWFAGEQTGWKTALSYEMVALAAVRSANPMFHLLPWEEASGCAKSPTFQVRCGCCGVRAALLFHLEFTAKARASCKGTGIRVAFVDLSSFYCWPKRDAAAGRDLVALSARTGWELPIHEPSSSWNTGVTTNQIWGEKKLQTRKITEKHDQNEGKS